MTAAYATKKRLRMLICTHILALVIGFTLGLSVGFWVITHIEIDV